MIKAIMVLAVWLGFGCGAQAVGSVGDLSIYDRTENRILPVFFHQGRYYVVGKPGNEYQVNVRNQQPGEVLAVVSVDGINVVSGETADWGQTGYVLSAHMNYGVKGWRKSMQRTAAFFFTEIENSYATRTGRPDHVGVIGVALFRKKAEPVAVLPQPYRERRVFPGAPGAATQENSARDEVRSQAAAQGEAAARQEPGDSASRLHTPPAAAEKSLGTGHGRLENSQVRHTSFERASQNPDEVITIYYDSYRNLVAQGVIRAAIVARPSPFPMQFVPDPR